MANLRTNNLCGEGGRNAYDGSVFFPGSKSYLRLVSGEVISGTGFGTGDFTIEFWINRGVNAGNYTGLVTLTSSTNVKRFEVAIHNSTIQVYTDTGAWRDTGYIPVSGVYEHIVFQRDYSGNTLKMYANGEEKWSVSNNRDYDEPFVTKIGIHGTGYDSFQGYLSNVRICIGHLVYSSNYFTPPTSPLTVHYTADDDKTVLLCCQDSDNPLQEATGKTIVGYGRHADSSVELVTNGGPTTDVTGWTAYNSSVAYDTGQIKVTRSGGTGFSAYATITNAVVGQRYRVSAQIRSASSRCDLYVTSAVASGTIISMLGTAGATVDVSGFFTAQYTTLYVFTAVDGDGDIGYYNRVSVKAADYGDAPKLIPPVGSDAGNTFGGAISMNSQDYMYFPTGRTEERVTVNNNFGARGLVMGGITYPGAGYVNTIEFIQIATLGNSVDFGDLTNKPNGGAGFSSKIRGFVAGGNTPEGYGINVIQFVTIATTGNATDFGDVGYTRSNGAGVSNNTRGVYAGGESASSPNPSLNNIEFVTMSTTGDGQDFGDLIDAASTMHSASSPTRGLYLGGYRDGDVNFIDFLTISTTGNTQDFGDLVNTARNGNGGVSNGHRGIVMGGYAAPARTNVIQYVSIQSTGNAIDFGDLTDARDPGVFSSLTRGVACSGDYPSNVNIIDFIEIMTTANAVDFGDMLTKTSSPQTCSNAHGGLADDM